MKKLSLILFSVLVLFFSKHSLSKEKIISDFSNKVKVIDGDTITIKGKNIRLHGIDAPEIKQICYNKYNNPYMCGIIAKDYLEDLINRRGVKEKKKIYCYYSSRARYKRIVGKCYIGAESKIHLNSNMVRFGYAVAYKKYSNDYVKEEEDAKFMKWRLWEGKFDLPEEWRRKTK